MKRRFTPSSGSRRQITAPSVLPPPWSFVTFLISAVASGYVVTLEDLDVGTADKRDHTMVFQDLGYFPQYNHS